MSIRAIQSATISFGLVSVPVKIYTAASSESVSFNMLTPAGNRVKQKYTDAVTGEPVEHKDCHKGFEVAKDQYVSFTADEIKALEAERDQCMSITEFVDASSVDPVQVEKSYYLGPDKGGDKGYTLLSQAMKAMGKVAVAKWAARGKDQLVVIRPFKDGLVLHQMYYANEVRDFSEIEVAKVSVSDVERDMAGKLLSALTTGEFAPNKYEDGYVKRVKTAIDQKASGTVQVAPVEASQPSVMDLFAALKASLENVSQP